MVSVGRGSGQDNMLRIDCNMSTTARNTPMQCAKSIIVSTNSGAHLGHAMTLPPRGRWLMPSMPPTPPCAAIWHASIAWRAPRCSRVSRSVMYVPPRCSPCAACVTTSSTLCKGAWRTLPPCCRGSPQLLPPMRIRGRGASQLPSNSGSRLPHAAHCVVWRKRSSACRVSPKTTTTTMAMLTCAPSVHSSFLWVCRLRVAPLRLPLSGKAVSMSITIECWIVSWAFLPTKPFGAPPI